MGYFPDAHLFTLVSDVSGSRPSWKAKGDVLSYVEALSISLQNSRIEMRLRHFDGSLSHPSEMMPYFQVLAQGHHGYPHSHGRDTCYSNATALRPSFIRCGRCVATFACGVTFGWAASKKNSGARRVRTKADIGTLGCSVWLWRSG